MTARINTALYTIFFISLLISFALSLILVFTNSGSLITAMLLLGALIISFLSQPKSIKSERHAALFIILIVLNVIIIAPELFLRVIGFHFESGVQYENDNEFGGLRPEHYMHFVPDKQLFWKLSSSNPNVNSLGFPGREIATPKPPNTYRILYLGDSVTQQGYARYVEEFLNEYLSEDSIRFECITLAVSGYSSYQGKVLAELYARKFEADLAFVIFGWNDHWLAYRNRDSQFHSAKNPTIVWHLYHNSRILQLANKAVHSVVRKQERGLLNEVRVLPDEYKQNLSQIESVFKGLDIPVVFITSPTSHNHLGVPDFLVKEKFARSRDSVISLHKQYNEIARSVAQLRGIEILDLEQEYDTLSNLPEMFVGDGIHLTRQGTEYTAQRIFEFIKDNYFSQPDNAVLK